MIYHNELVYFKRNRGLQYFADTWNTSTYKQLLTKTVSKSTIHGIQNLGMTKQRLPIACFWIVLVITATCGSVATYFTLSDRLNQQQLKTVVETSQLPVYNVEFPAVAICPWNKINWMRLKAGEKRFLPPNATVEMKNLFQQLLLVMAKMAFGRFDHLESLQNVSLELLNGISIIEVAKFFAVRCDEVFEATSCIFDGTQHDCCKLFITEYTEKGICLTFNSMISEESRKMKLSFQNYPWKISKAGEGSGLKFILHYNRSFDHFEQTMPFSFNLMIKAPNDWSAPLIHILYPNTHNFISVTPQITITSNNTRSLQPAKRRCLFNDEKPFDYKEWVLEYSQTNCLVRCQKLYLRKICNCSMQLFLPESDSVAYDIKPCNPSHLHCLFENRDIFSYIKIPRQDYFIKETRRGMFCDCLPSCYSIFYLLMLNVKNLLNTNVSSPIIKADIHFAQRTMIKYSTQLEYTYMDLLANFGGILGLFIGASALSLAEILYVLLKFLRLLIIDRRTIQRVVSKKFQRKQLRK